MARLFPRHAVDRFLEHNLFYARGQCTIQEGWNGFKRGSNRRASTATNPVLHSLLAAAPATPAEKLSGHTIPRKMG